MSERPERIVVIVGPTAGGKSELAVAVARRFDGEVIGADSMQVYRELDAGTAKPPAELRAAGSGGAGGVPHHLIDIVEPTERFTVADWLSAAEALIADLHGRGKLPVVVGGTNLYLKALLEGMFEGPPGDETFRASLDVVASHELHGRLAVVDPEAAGRINHNDRKRIVRALEVFHATGKPISAHQTQWQEPSSLKAQVSSRSYRHNPILIGLRWGTEAINRRINSRVKQMFHPVDGSQDLVSETRRLLEAGRLGPQAREALGTKQVLEHLAGRCTAEEAMERVKIETRRYAKAQRTWLKRYRGVYWLEAESVEAEELERKALEIVAKVLSGDVPL